MSVESFIENAPSTFILATQLPAAHGTPLSGLATVRQDSFDDEGHEWDFYLNGSGEQRTDVVRTHGDQFPDQCAINWPAGSCLVVLDGAALAVLKPDEQELYCDRDETHEWEHAILGALHGRLTELGVDLPPLDELVSDREGVQA
ncbi:hypothetical protein DEQ92_20435 [Haloferax sp. Atlit-6N]|uniref:hypothetical protein n=1 Tax=Haloferax sp. Atlit-6N TaxID=2077205 RepID=UPI000E238885|nr:hypothetical protein [Haloferax sp. Atlit-6N]REA00221.1 hypothetical protein DEQ92_20435 [Haloferax sp. Atlit-6N]